MATAVEGRCVFPLEPAVHNLGESDSELIEFEGAPHTFFDRKQEQFQAASNHAWERTLEFIAARS